MLTLIKLPKVTLRTVTLKNVASQKVLRQRGVSLVELMISMALGFASLTAMTSLVSHGIALNNSLMAKSRLDEEIHGVMAVINQDLKRAGYHGQTAIMLLDPASFINPFSKSINVSEFGSEDADSCITFSYDRNHNSLLDNIVVNEQFGFRLKNKAIEIRVDGYNCNQSYWQDLTDTQVISVTKLAFSVETLAHQQVGQLRILVKLQAQLVRYPGYSKNISTQFLIRNYD